MVTAAGRAVRADSLRPLNAPRSIRVDEGRYREPRAVLSGGAMQAVSAIRDRWRIYDRWWTGETVIRMYWELELASGEVVTLFHDRVGGGWYRQRDR